MRHVETWLAAGMAIMSLIVIGLVLYLDDVTGELADHQVDHPDHVPALLAIIEEQNRVIEAFGGTPVTVTPTTTTTTPPRTTIASTTSTTSTSSTTTTTAPCRVRHPDGRCAVPG